MKDKTYFMKMALKEAYKSLKKDEVPVGAVIVRNGEIIARAHNCKETKKCAVFHAEMLAIMKASRKINSWYLDECDIYVTLEPCQMCASAIISSRLSSVYFGAYSQFEDLSDIYQNNRLNYKVKTVEGGILKEECSNILTDFFKKRRKGD